MHVFVAAELLETRVDGAFSRVPISKNAHFNQVVASMKGNGSSG